MQKDVSGIIVAAGKATRMQGIDKQWLLLDGKPVILHSVLSLSQVVPIREIVIVTKKEDVRRMKQLIHEYSIEMPCIVTEGGASRQQSVANGLRACCDDTRYIAVHDGARPLVLPADIERVIADAKKYKAATLGVKVKETIKVADSRNMIIDTPDRDTLYLTQTPQVFEKELYKKGLQCAAQNGIEYTDDCQLAEAIGQSVYMTHGSYSNLKITTPEDVALAEAIRQGIEKRGK